MSSPMDPPVPGKYVLRELLSGPAREFYRRLAEDGELATTRCEQCQTASFPPREICPTCGGELSWISLPRRGRLHAFTTQEAALRFRAPDVLALAEVGDVVVPGIVFASYGDLHIGQEVTVELMAESETGLTLLSFQPVEDS